MDRKGTGFGKDDIVLFILFRMKSLLSGLLRLDIGKMYTGEANHTIVSDVKGRRLFPFAEFGVSLAFLGDLVTLHAAHCNVTQHSIA